MPRMRDGRPWSDLGGEGAAGARRRSGLILTGILWRVMQRYCACWPAGTAKMPIRLDARAADFPQKFRAFLDTKREASADVEQAVRAIIADVAARGDAALIELTKKFDRLDLTAMGMRVTPAELDAAAGACAK